MYQPPQLKPDKRKKQLLRNTEPLLDTSTCVVEFACGVCFM